MDASRIFNRLLDPRFFSNKKSHKLNLPCECLMIFELNLHRQIENRSHATALILPPEQSETNMRTVLVNQLVERIAK